MGHLSSNEHGTGAQESPPGSSTSIALHSDIKTEDSNIPRKLDLLQVTAPNYAST